MAIEICSRYWRSWWSSKKYFDLCRLLF